MEEVADWTIIRSNRQVDRQTVVGRLGGGRVKSVRD